MELSRPEVQAAVRAAVEVLAAAGASVQEVRLPVYAQACSATMHGLAAEALAYHRADLRSRWSDFGRPTRAALLTGALLGGADYVQAQRVRRHAVSRLADLFAGVDVVLGPTATGPAPAVDDLDFGAVVAMLQTTYWDATGNPALSIPVGQMDGLPVGLQVVGRPFDDRTVLDVGRAFQSLTDHHQRVPVSALTRGPTAGAAGTEAP
jgi:aspartyl-tRNA(Asn)/glutamyl-tRNA(Gln) amidotransferase subunit A